MGLFVLSALGTAFMVLFPFLGSLWKYGQTIGFSPNLLSIGEDQEVQRQQGIWSNRGRVGVEGCAAVSQVESELLTVPFSLSPPPPLFHCSLGHGLSRVLGKSSPLLGIGEFCLGIMLTVRLSLQPTSCWHAFGSWAYLIWQYPFAEKDKQ